MPAETMHNFCVAEAERLLEDDFAKWSKAPLEKLAAVAIANVKAKLKLKHAVAGAIDMLLREETTP